MMRGEILQKVVEGKTIEDWKSMLIYSLTYSHELYDISSSK